MGGIRCAEAFVAFHSCRDATIRSQARIYLGGASSDAFYVSMLSEKYRKSGTPFIKGMIEGAEAGLASLMKKERSSSMIYVFQKKVKA